MSVNPYQTPHNVDTTPGTNQDFVSTRIQFVPANETEVLQIRRLARPGRRKMVAAFIVFVAAFELFLVYVAATSFSFAPAVSVQISIIALVFLPIVVVAPYVFWRIRVRRELNSDQPDAIDAIWELKIDGIHFTDAETDVKVSWDSFSGFRTSEHVCLLFWKTDSGYFPVIRRCFSTQFEWQSWLSFLNSKLPEV